MKSYSREREDINKWIDNTINECNKHLSPLLLSLVSRLNEREDELWNSIWANFPTRREWRDNAERGGWQRVRVKLRHKGEKRAVFMRKLVRILKERERHTFKAPNIYCCKEKGMFLRAKESFLDADEHEKHSLKHFNGKEREREVRE